MKIFKKAALNLKKNKKGFTLIEAVTATALVAVSASLAVGVFANGERMSVKQQTINQGQNTALTSAETYLETGGKSATGEMISMKPVSGSGFAVLNDNHGAIGVSVSTFVDSGTASDSGAQYKAFKPASDAAPEYTPDGDDDGDDDDD